MLLKDVLVHAVHHPLLWPEVHDGTADLEQVLSDVLGRHFIRNPFAGLFIKGCRVSINDRTARSSD